MLCTSFWVHLFAFFGKATALVLSDGKHMCLCPPGYMVDGVPTLLLTTLKILKIGLKSPLGIIIIMNHISAFGR